MSGLDSGVGNLLIAGATSFAFGERRGARRYRVWATDERRRKEEV
jgi:hypothetical protein